MIILVTILSVLTVFTQILSSLTDLKSDDQSKKGLSRLTTNGWVFYVCSILLVIFPIIQKLLQDDLDRQKDYEFQERLINRDLMLRKSYDSLTNERQKFTVEILGKYGYKLDSINETLVRIKDSSKSFITYSADPILRIPMETNLKGIVFLGREGSVYTFKIFTASFDAGSSEYELDYDFVLEDSLGRLYFVPSNLDRQIARDTKLSKDSGVEFTTSFVFNQNLRKVYIWFHGSYKRVDGSGKFYVDDVYSFDMISKKILIHHAALRDEVIEFVKVKKK